MRKNTIIGGLLMIIGGYLFVKKDTKEVRNICESDPDGIFVDGYGYSEKNVDDPELLELIKKEAEQEV